MQIFKCRAVAIASTLSLSLVCNAFAADTARTPNGTVESSRKKKNTEEYRRVTILATNDIHGGVEAQIGKDGIPAGGMAFWTGAVRAIKKGLRAKYGKNSGVLLVDAGDQFQGTLLSNFSEGKLVFSAMNEAGYDAIVPGNHDYDFGPVGWLDDKVTEETEDRNPRGALERLVAKADFPLISANTYFKDTIVDSEGNRVDVDGVGCRPKNPDAKIHWKDAERPPFLEPYLIKRVANVRVAMIGIDHVGTPHSTTAENVSDLCFRDEKDTYLEIREKLSGKADIFVLVIHNGNSSQEFNASDLAREITEARSNALHVVIAGHTHFINHAWVNGVPIIQSGSGGVMFGRVDLVWDSENKALVTEKTKTYAGVRMDHEKCAPSIKEFCQVVEPSPSQKAVAYEGVRVKPSHTVHTMIAKARDEVSSLADRKLGVAEAEVWRDRIQESPMSNAMTDALRDVAKAEVAMINTGGLRDELPAGEVTYEHLFKVLPFSNHAVTVGPMSFSQLLSVLQRSVQSCGSYSAMMQSGLRVEFSRNCGKAQDGVDKAAKVLRVETLGGELLLDVKEGVRAADDRVFQVATLDFLAAGGSGYMGFIGIPLVQDFGILREALTERFLASPVQFSSKVDGRWKQVQNSTRGDVRKN